MKKFILLFWTCIILIGCNSTPKVDLVAEAESIRNIEAEWLVALQNMDTDKIMSIYSPEGVVMKPNNAIYVGLQSIREQVESDFADTTILWNTTSSNIDIIEVSASGDIAYARGINRSKMKTQAGIVEISDKWIDMYKKNDGQWKCIVGIWNSNNPLETK
jgi:ketosteroid isomerase-like protein